MSTYRTPQIIHLSSEAVSHAQAFAQTVTGTVNYRDSNQLQTQKIGDDHFVSKLGEEAACSVFIARHCIVEGPDYSIYAGKQKSWTADLKINNLDVAVKTQRRSAATLLSRILRSHHSAAKVQSSLTASYCYGTKVTPRNRRR